MSVRIERPVLKGQKALVVGIVNEHSIAWGCAKVFRELGADRCGTAPHGHRADRRGLQGPGPGWP